MRKGRGWGRRNCPDLSIPMGGPRGVGPGRLACNDDRRAQTSQPLGNSANYAPEECRVWDIATASKACAPRSNVRRKSSRRTGLPGILSDTMMAKPTIRDCASVYNGDDALADLIAPNIEVLLSRRYSELETDDSFNVILRRRTLARPLKPGAQRERGENQKRRQRFLAGGLSPCVKVARPPATAENNGRCSANSASPFRKGLRRFTISK